jgi:hypothetical protein
VAEDDSDGLIVLFVLFMQNLKNFDDFNNALLISGRRRPPPRKTRAHPKAGYWQGRIDKTAGRIHKTNGFGQTPAFGLQRGPDL